MASALDEDTQETLAAGRESLKATLRSIQKDLQKVAIVYLVGFVGTFYALRVYVWDFFQGMTRARMDADVNAATEIIAQTPFEVILLQAKIGLIVGGIIALPVLIYFSRDELRARGMWPQSPIPRWKLALLALLSIALFSAGVSYAIFVFFPVIFNFLAGFGLEAGISPTYSIVMWTEFIVFLSLSFGLAGQMPLFITGLSYAEIVQYETFRDKWRHAVVGIFVFGAFFSPPDPFTQIMWAVPLMVLYGFSLYLAKIVVTAKRGSEQIDVVDSARSHWNVIAGTAVLGGAVVYGFYEYGGRQAINDTLAWLGSSYRVVPPGEGLGLDPVTAATLYAVVWGLAFATLAVLWAVYTELETTTAGYQYGDPTEIDLENLDAEGVRAAPEDAFLELTEEQAIGMAGQAMENDDPERAQAILDRFDDTEAEREAADGTDEEADGNDTVSDGVSDRASRAGSTFLEDFTEDDGEEIGGYYKDIRFILDSLRSRSFRIVGVFLLAMAGTFAWLYLGGLGDVRRDLESRVPAQVDGGINIITLHPVEALIFMVKFSVLIGVFAVLPMIVYYAWPALRERGFVRGHRRQLFVWTGALTAGMVGGFALGYGYIAPTLIAWLVEDAERANMIITYQVSDFLWLVIFTTIGIGFLADIPIAMVLMNSVGITYQTFRGRWREVTVTIMMLAALFTPADVVTMFLITIPLMAAYGAGLAALFLVTFGGRRNLAPPASIGG